MDIFQNQRLVTLNARQDGLVNSWGLNFKGRGTVIAVTGFGKTVVGIKAMRKVFDKNENRTFLIVVPSEPLYDQWQERLKEYPALASKTKVEIINTAIKNVYQVDMLILDEVHRFQSDEFGKIFKCVNYKYVLGLTATIDKDKQMLINHYCPVVDAVSFDEALKNEWISEFIIYNIPVEISEEDNKIYADLTKKFNQYFAFFNHDFDIAMSCVTNISSRYEYARTIESYERYNTDEYRTLSHREKLNKIVNIIYINALNWNKAMRERKSFLYESSEKLKIAKHIIEKAKGKNYKILAFSQSKTFADELAKLTGSIAYHSGITKAKRKKILNAFYSMPTGVLCAAKALDEGADIPDINLTINAAYTSSKIQGTQRLGRGVRYIEGKNAIIINLYISPKDGKFSQDFKWLKANQKNMPNVNWLTSVDELEI